MTVLSRYLLRRTVLPFAVTLSVVLLALTLERLLEITRIVTDRGAPVGRAFDMILALLPHYLGLGVPAAVFLAVLVAFNHLRQDHELSVMHAAGISLPRLLRPVLAAALVLCVLMAINTAFLQPHGRHAYRSTLHAIADGGLPMRIVPGVFYELGDGTVLRAGAVGAGGQNLERVFAARETADGGRTFVVAETGTLATDSGTGNLIVRMARGTLIRDTGDARTAKDVNFERYVWQLRLRGGATHGPRGQDERELTVPELMSSAPVAGAPLATSRRVAELNKRLVTVVSIPLLVLLAAPIAVLRNGRGGRLTRYAVAVALLVLYQKLLAVAEGLVVAGSLPPWAGQWGVVGGFALVAVALLRVAHAGGIGASRRRQTPLSRAA